MPKLYIAENGEETVYEIFEDEVSLGRGAANDVQIHGTAASKMHAVIRQLQGHWKLIDLESRNGTLVNGAFRNQHWLRDGDTVRVGEANVRYAAEGAPQGSPAAGVATPAKPVPAKPAAARPTPAMPAKPVPAQPAPAPAPAPTPAEAPEPAHAAVGDARPTFTPAPTVARSSRRGGGGRSRGRRDDHDDYDYDDDMDDLPPRRRSSNSGTIVMLGILGVVAFVGLFFLISSGGSGVNQGVIAAAEKMATRGDYEGALRYVETHADPDGEHYWAVVQNVEQWRKLAVAEKEAKFETEARDHYDYEIFRRQAVTGRRKGGFRAKDALPEDEVARMLREFLLAYPNTAAARALMNGKQSDYRHLRDAMLENRDPNVKSPRVIQGLTADHDIDVSARRFSAAYMRLDYLRSAYKLIMTSENYTEFRKAIQFKIDDVMEVAASKWKDDKALFDKHLGAGSKAKARKQLADMKQSYGEIPEFASKIKALEQRL